MPSLATAEASCSRRPLSSSGRLAGVSRPQWDLTGPSVCLRAGVPAVASRKKLRRNLVRRRPAQQHSGCQWQCLPGVATLGNFRWIPHGFPDVLQLTRRDFLGDTGRGAGGLALRVGAATGRVALAASRSKPLAIGFPGASFPHRRQKLHFLTRGRQRQPARARGSVETSDGFSRRRCPSR